MKIVVVGPAHPYRGGIAHFVDRLALGMLERGHTVDVVTFTRQYPGFLFPGSSQTVVDATSTSVDAVPPGKDLARRQPERLIDSINPLSWGRAGRRIAALKPDVVILNYWLSFFSPSYRRIAQIAKRSGAQVLVVAHNAVPHEPKIGDSIMARYLFRIVDGVIALSRQVKQDLEDTIGVTVPVVVSPHPVYDNFGPPVNRQEARTTLGLGEEKSVMLFFGFIRQYKGLDILLHAMPQIVERLPEAMLVVAGEFYDNEQTYKRIVEDLGIGRHVRFDSTYIADAQVPTYFCAADLVVQPYRSATQSGVAQIAFYYERPILVTDVGGLSEVVRHDKVGFVVPPESPGAIAASVSNFFVKQRAADMASSLQREKANYSWDGFCTAIEQLTGQLVGQITEPVSGDVTKQFETDHRPGTGGKQS